MASPSGTDVTRFDGAWISEQTRLVDPSALLSPTLQLSNLQLGSLHLGLSVRKDTPAATGTPALRYTAADLRREWLRQMTSRTAHKMALTGGIDSGSARGLSFGLSRLASGGAFTDSSLGFTRGGLETHMRIRDVAANFARTGVVTDDEWNAAKDLIGWRQSEMSMKWTGTPGLSLTTLMDSGKKAGTGESRGRRRLEMGWTGTPGTNFSFYSEQTSAGSRGKSSSGRATGFSLSQKVGQGFTFGLAEDAARALNGDSTRLQKLSLGNTEAARTYISANFVSSRKNGQTSREQRFAFRSDPNASAIFSASLLQNSAGSSRSFDRRLEVKTREKARTYLSAGRVQTGKDGKTRTEDTFHFRAAPSAALQLSGDYLRAMDGAKGLTDSQLHMDWKPARTWTFNGNWRQRAGVAGDFANLKLAGMLDSRTSLVATMVHVPDGSTPNLRQDGLHLERTLWKDSRLTADWLSLVTKQGAAAHVSTMDLRSALPFGLVLANWRRGGGSLLRDATSLSFTNSGISKARVHVDAAWKRTAGCETSRSLKCSWNVRKGLSLDAAYALHPEDSNGVPQNTCTRTTALNWALKDGWKLAASLSGNRSGATTIGRKDLTLSGKFLSSGTFDLGLSTLKQAGKPNVPAYHVSIQQFLDSGHRFICKVERQTRAINGKDNITGQLELLTDF